MCGQIIGIYLPYVQLQSLRNLMNVLPVDTICSIEYCGEFAFCVPIQNGIFLFICSIEYCGEFAFCVPIQNGIFLFICSIEYYGEFAFCVPIQNGIFLF